MRDVLKTSKIISISAVPAHKCYVGPCVKWVSPPRASHNLQDLVHANSSLQTEATCSLYFLAFSVQLLSLRRKTLSQRHKYPLSTPNFFCSHSITACVRPISSQHKGQFPSSTCHELHDGTTWIFFSLHALFFFSFP